jgi:alanine racemase
MLPQHGTLYLSRSRLRHNLALLRAAAPPKAVLCATVKANAYGHGMAPLSRLLLEEGVHWAAVYNLAEAFALPKGFDILMLAPLVVGHPSEIPLEAFQRVFRTLRCNLTDMTSARHLSAALSRAKVRHKLNVHIQIDAGLTRAGVHPRDAAELARAVAKLPGLHLEGLFAHFSHGDIAGHATIHQQLSTFLSAALPLKQENPNLLLHCQNSGGTFHAPAALAQHLHLIRAGIALYGLQPAGGTVAQGNRDGSDSVGGGNGVLLRKLRPIARLTGPLLMIHERPAQTGVGYGHTFTTSRPSRLGIIPVGYADGYPRALSNGAVAQWKKKTIPLVGRVSMDQVIVDLTDLPARGRGAPQVGDELTLISDDPEAPNCLDCLAPRLGTINYEIATGWGDRLKREVK